MYLKKQIASICMYIYDKSVKRKLKKKIEVHEEAFHDASIILNILNTIRNYIYLYVLNSWEYCNFIRF